MKTIFPSLKYLLLAALVASGAARADITVFTNQTAFAAAVGAPWITDTFDDLPIGLYESALPLARNIGRVSAGINGGNTDTFSGVAGGAGDMWLSATHVGSSVAFWNLNVRYGPAGAGVGGNFFITDDDGNLVNGTIDVTLLTPQGSQTVRLSNPTADTFVGFVAPSITEIAVTPIDGTFHVTANNFTLAAAVPEPETFAMVTAGLGAIGWAARRRSLRP